mgnify:CR=1 FL=1
MEVVGSVIRIGIAVAVAIAVAFTATAVASTQVERACAVSQSEELRYCEGEVPD